MSTIKINGNTYSGDKIVITDEKIIINGKDITEDSKEINISVEGNIDELKVDTCNKVWVSGNIKNIATQSGDIDVIGDVNGNIQTMSGHGSISTMSGDIKNKR